MKENASIKFESNTIGDFDSPTKEDIERAFLDPQSVEMAGNLFHLATKDGLLSCVSDPNREGYGLSWQNGKDTAQTAIQSIPLEKAIHYFERYRSGDTSWFDELKWRAVPKATWLQKRIPHIIIAILVGLFLLKACSDLLRK